jgi:hypothetical protein
VKDRFNGATKDMDDEGKDCEVKRGVCQVALSSRRKSRARVNSEVRPSPVLHTHYAEGGEHVQTSLFVFPEHLCVSVYVCLSVCLCVRAAGVFSVCSRSFLHVIPLHFPD